MESPNCFQFQTHSLKIVDHAFEVFLHLVFILTSVFLFCFLLFFVFCFEILVCGLFHLPKDN